jgi:hypothetical protein
MTNNSRNKSAAAKFTALKTRLAVEAILFKFGIRPEVNDLTLILTGESFRCALQFGDATEDFMEISVVFRQDTASPVEFEEALARGPVPAGTEAQIVQFEEINQPFLVANSRLPAPVDAWEVVRWCAACENLLPQKDLLRPFSLVLERKDQEPGSEEEPDDTAKARAANATRAELLDFLLEHFGAEIRVTAACDTDEESILYGVCYGDGWFQFLIQRESAQICRLRAVVMVGRLFSRQAYAAKWLLKNCAARQLTLRPRTGDERGNDLQIGCNCLVPAGRSAALRENLQNILDEGSQVATGLRLWFPNLIDGDLVGTISLRAGEAGGNVPLLGISDPAALAQQLKEVIAEHPLQELDMNLAFKAALWSGSYTTAIEWADQYEAVLSGLPPADNDAENDERERQLYLARETRVRALKALGRYGEALAAYDNWTSAVEEPTTCMAICRAILLIRLRRLEEAESIVQQLKPEAGLMGILTQTLVAAGLGRADEAKAGLDLYESLVGEDIAAQALFRELTTEYEQNTSAADAEVDRLLDQIARRQSGDSHR